MAASPAAAQAVTPACILRGKVLSRRGSTADIIAMARGKASAPAGSLAELRTGRVFTLWNFLRGTSWQQ
jgi:hypothetical protein